MTQSKTATPKQTPAAAAPPPVPASGDLADMPIAQLEAAVTQAKTALGTIIAALPNPTHLTQEERQHSSGHLKNGESAKLQIIADVCADPANARLVQDLADKDYGVDPTQFEAALLKERLERVDLLTPLAEKLQGLAQKLNDTVDELQSLSAPPLREAYAVLKVVSKNNATLRSSIAPVIDFYAKIAQAAAETRRAKKAAAENGDKPPAAKA